MLDEVQNEFIRIYGVVGRICDGGVDRHHRAGNGTGLESD